MKTTHTSVSLIAALLVAGVLAGCGPKETGAPPAAPDVTKAPGPATATSAFEKLRGKWQRPDGGYVIEIRSMESGGKLDAAYFNPRPIHVARAMATQDGGMVKVFIELRDVNYPGSTYTLIYDPGKDQLMGNYFQAVARETYEVFFERMKP